VRMDKPARIVGAAPVGAPETCHRLQQLADEVVCAETPTPFSAVGLWYERFDQVSDEEVIALLRSTAPAAASDSKSAGGAAARPGQESATPGDTPGLIRERAIRLYGEARDYDALLEAIGDARLVLLGEASHGTHEFYRERAFITERLIAERGFTAVAA